MDLLIQSILLDNKTENKDDLPKNLLYFNGEIEGLFDFFSKQQTKYYLFVVDFYADWCAPCKRLGSLLPNIAKSYPKVMFLKVNVEENREISNKFSIHSLPTLKFFLVEEDGIREVSTLRGCNPYALEERCKELLPKAKPPIPVINCKYSYE